MTQMTDYQLNQHIQSNNWESVRSVRQGSADYSTGIGILRVMFGMEDDPVEVTTLVKREGTEVWAKFEKVWEKVFP